MIVNCEILPECFLQTAGSLFFFGVFRKLQKVLWGPYSYTFCSACIKKLNLIQQVSPNLNDPSQPSPILWIIPRRGIRPFEQALEQLRLVPRQLQQRPVVDGLVVHLLAVVRAADEGRKVDRAVLEESLVKVVLHAGGVLTGRVRKCEDAKMRGVVGVAGLG